MRDYQMLGVCLSTIVTVGAGIIQLSAIAAATFPAEKFDFMTVVCLEAGTIDTVVLRYPSTTWIPNVAVNMSPGSVLYGVKTFQPTAGRFQIFFHKS